jgi:hypothetical protein
MMHVGIVEFVVVEEVKGVDTEGKYFGPKRYTNLFERSKGLVSSGFRRAAWKYSAAIDLKHKMLHKIFEYEDRLDSPRIDSLTNTMLGSKHADDHLDFYFAFPIGKHFVANSVNLAF